MASFEAGPCGVPPFCTLHRFAPGPATPRTDDANQADHADEARRHAPSIANLRSQRRPLRPKHPFFGASGRGGLHVEHNTDNPAHKPPRNGGFCYHRTPVTACRRRVAALWSQFPPRQQEQTRQQGTARITPVREHYTTMRDATGNRLGCWLLRALCCSLLGILCAAS